jgi:hypothetical protein
MNRKRILECSSNQTMYSQKRKTIIEPSITTLSMVLMTERINKIETELILINKKLLEIHIYLGMDSIPYNNHFNLYIS